jgi:hypothetical protein
MTADLDLRIDAETGLPLEGLSILAALSARLGTLSDAITRDLDDRRARRRLGAQPVPFWVPGAPIGQAQATVGTLVGGQLVLDLGGPQTGRKWEIRGLAVSDAGNAAATVTGVANWYVGKATPPVSPVANWVPLAPTAWRWTFPNLPNLTTFSSASRSVLSPDRLYCVITGGTLNQNILAAAEIKDFDPVQQMVEESV